MLELTVKTLKEKLAVENGTEATERVPPDFSRNSLHNATETPSAIGDEHVVSDDDIGSHVSTPNEEHARLVVEEGKSRYVSDGFWASFSEEVNRT